MASTALAGKYLTFRLGAEEYGIPILKVREIIGLLPITKMPEAPNFVRGIIQGYGYAVDRRGERLYWYDPQPHPNDPSLAATFPHHKHVPPDIKRHRIPATGIAFDHPNLPVLVEEIERDLLSIRA